jgi:hypothetical protein
MKVEQSATKTGLCTTMVYDPYYARAIEGLKRILLQGNPIMMRLHPGADYELPEEALYSVDLEGQAVLVTGYDDETREFIVQDPWSPEFGAGPSGKRRMGYWELSYRMVNASRGYAAAPRPPMCTARVEDKGDHSEITLEIGLYTPDLNIMDATTSWLENIAVSVSGVEGVELLESGSQRVEGRFGHGEVATFRFRAEVQSNDPSLGLVVTADYVAERPYKFREHIQTEVALSDFATRQVVLPLAASI